METSELLSLHIPNGENDPLVARVQTIKFNHELMRMNEEKGVLAFDTLYDRQGRIIEQISFGPAGNEMDRLKISYHENGKIAKKETYSEGVLAETEEYFFDEDDRLLKTEVHYSGELGTVIHNEWDTERELILRIRHENDEGEMELEVNRTYDDKKNLLVEEHAYDWGGKARFVYTYDEDGRELTLRGTDQDSNLVRSIENTYRPDGSLKTRSYRNFESGESYDSRHSIVEEDDKSIQIVELHDGSVQKVVLNTKNGNLAEEYVIYGPDKGIHLQQSFTYENGFRKEETYFRRGVDHHRLEYHYEFYK